MDRATRGMPAPRVRDIRVIHIGGGGVNDSTVVKVETIRRVCMAMAAPPTLFPGGRAKLVGAAVEQYLKPIVVGRSVDRIEQIWQICYMSSYYKNDAVLNCAIGGVCDALWDIKGASGRHAGVPARGRQMSRGR